MGLIRIGVSPSVLSADSVERLEMNGLRMCAVYEELLAVPNVPETLTQLM